MFQAEGIDVSQHQGTIDWKIVKDQSGKEFAYIRIGWGESKNASGGELDTKAIENINRAIEIGLPISLYIYSYAQNAEEARMEANFVKTVLALYPRNAFIYPIVIDVEDKKYQENVDINPIIDTFCTEIHSIGYKPMYYTFLSWYKTKVNDIIKGKWDCYLAQWDDSPEFTPSIWQYSDSGQIPGISGNVDLDRSFKDYINIDNPFGSIVPINLVVTAPASNSIEVVAVPSADVTVFSVLEEQRALTFCNYGVLDPDGIDGPETQRIRNVARAGYNLPQTGKAGLDMESCLRGQIITYQSKLNELGYVCSIDGRLGDAGTETIGQMKQFQIDRGLIVDGIVGSSTFNALFSNAPAVVVTAPAVMVAEGMASKNFSWYEFACGCIKGDPTSSCNGYPKTNYGQIIAQQLIDKLQQLRDYVGAIVITCGIRCPENNKYWQGVWNSLHMLGEAIDCYCPGLDIIEFARIAWQAFGIAVRVYPSQGFAHLELSDLGGVYNQETGVFIY
ncbi:GH25 family lysozyme [Acetobacterium malicum]|nr:GH25 family lysozyme [Acetobacterium malicum]